MLRLLRFGPKGAEVRPDQQDPLLAAANLAAQGDKRAQRTLLVELGPALLRTARGILGTANPDVEDVLQEAMASVIAALPGFRGECTIRHFASRVAAQVALGARRRARVRARYSATRSDDELADVATSDSSPAESAEAARRRAALRELLCALPEIHSEVLALHVVLGFTVDETALTLNVPVNTVRSRLRRALASLRDTLQEHPPALEILQEEA